MVGLTQGYSYEAICTCIHSRWWLYIPKRLGVYTYVCGAWPSWLSWLGFKEFGIGSMNYELWSYPLIQQYTPDKQCTCKREGVWYMYMYTLRQHMSATHVHVQHMCTLCTWLLSYVLHDNSQHNQFLDKLATQERNVEFKAYYRR